MRLKIFLHRRFLVLTLLLVVIATGASAYLLRARLFSPKPPALEPPLWSETLSDHDRIILSYTPLPMQFETVRSASFEKLYRGDTAKKMIALTFDDGPKPGSTEKLLAILQEHRAKATFFDVGKAVEAHPELVVAQLNGGHCVGNHTWNHDRLTRVTAKEMLKDIRRGAEAIEKATGQSPRYFRPPGGGFDRTVLNAVQDMGYLSVLWSTNTGDYLQPASRVISANVLKNAGNGSIILFHEGVPETLEALPEIITTLRARGYALVTIDEMLGKANPYSLPLPVPEHDSPVATSLE